MEGGGHLMEQQFEFDKTYKIPLDERLYRTNLDYFQGIGKYSKKECHEKALVVSGYRFVDEEEHEDYFSSVFF